MPIEWKDWAGSPARYKGGHKGKTKEPEWASCTAERFWELLEEADEKGVTLIEMQGNWDYPASDKEIEV